MSADEARAAAPSFAPALKVYGDPKRSPIWLPVGAGKGQARIHDSGLGMIEIVYPSGAIAEKTLTNAWGMPTIGESSFDWHGWYDSAHSIRAILMKGDGAELDRLELLPYRPLRELMIDGGELAYHGKHLLDCDDTDLAPLLAHTSGEDIQLLPTEMSSGQIPLRIVRRKGEKSIRSYVLGIDFTYDKPVREAVLSALVKHFGTPDLEKREPLSSKECRRFPPTKGGVHARACTLYSQWQIEIARAEVELGF